MNEMDNIVVASLDISTRTGYAIFEVSFRDGTLKLITTGISDYKDLSPLKAKYDGENHPKDFVDFVDHVTDGLIDLLNKYGPQYIFIEQTSKARQRYVQKLLEWIHFGLILKLNKINNPIVKYINTTEWRSKLGIKMDKKSREVNHEIRQIHKRKATTKEEKAQKTAEIKELGGLIITPKVLALRLVASLFNYDFSRKKDNDAAEAICIGLASIDKSFPNYNWEIIQ